MMRETWYVLEDGAAADPNECALDASGVLRHKSGATVAMRGDTPSSRGVDVEEERKKRSPRAQTPKAPAAQSAAKDMKPEDPTRPYRTREAKSE